MEFKVQDREVVLDDNLAKLTSVLEMLQTKLGETSEVKKDERKIKKNKEKMKSENSNQHNKAIMSLKKDLHCSCKHQYCW